MRVSPNLISRPETNVYQPSPEGIAKPLPLPSEQPIINKKISALASDWSSGKIQSQEATTRFIKAATDALKDSLSEKDYQNMVDQLTDLLINDQEFIKDLGKNLNRLS